MKVSWQHIALLLALLLVLNGVDYAHLGDVWNDGKTRYLLLSLVPISLFFFQTRLGFAPAFVGALALLSWVTHDFKPSHDAVLPIISIFAVLAISSCLMTLGERTFGTVLIASGVIQGTIALLQWARAANFLPFAFWHHAKPDGLIGNHTLLAPFLVACLAPALWRGNWISALLIGSAVLACQSVGGLVCLGVLLGVWLCEWQRFLNWWPFLIAGIPIAVAFAAQVAYGRSITDSDGRFFMWSFGWKAVKERPWFGSGIGAWDQIYLPRFQGEILEQFHFHLPRAIHNDFLDFAIEYGIAPLLVLSSEIARWIYRFRPTWPHAICAELLADSFFSFPASQLYLALPFVVCWAFSGRAHGLASSC